MRNIIAYFIKYPVSVNIIMFAFIIFGYIGLTNMKSSFFPLTPTKNINIQLTYPGASPGEIEEGVVLKIEDNLKGIIGVDRVTSKSSENAASIIIESDSTVDIDDLLADVKNAVDRVPSFPSGMEPPVVSKVEGLSEALSFTLSGKNVPLSTLKKIARKIEADLLAIPGISQIALTGFPLEEIEIAVRENDLRAFQLSFEEVARAVSSSNILSTGGTIKTDEEDYLIRAKNRSYYGDELDQIVVRAGANGDVIRLKDIASVKDKWSESPDRIYFNGETAIQFKVSTTNNEDLVSASDKSKEYIRKFNATRENLKLVVVQNPAMIIVQRSELLLKNGLQGIFLVLLFLSIFLRPQLAFWVAVGLPVSFLGFFMMASQFGITLNVLSLFALIIVIGILVDDGIVIAENIFHHHERGKSRIQAAIDGTLEVLPPVIAAVLTTIVAFATFFFFSGSRVGDLFSEVSTVVVLTLGISLIEALIILPAHLAHSSAMNKETKPFFINRWADNVMAWLRDKIYEPILRFFLEYKILGFAIPLALFLLTIGSIRGGIIGVTFFPPISSDRITVSLGMPQGTNEEITDSIMQVIERVAWEVNEEYSEKQAGEESVIQNSVRRIGPGTASASLDLNLLPGEARNFTAYEISNSVEERLGPIYGAEKLIFGSGTNFGGKPVSISLVGNDIAELKAAKEELKVEMRKITSLKDIADNDPQGVKEIQLSLKESAYLLGLNLNTVMSQVRSGFFGLQVQRFQRGRDEIKVWVRYERDNRNSLQELEQMWISTPSGSRVPLSEIAQYKIERGEIDINHLDGQRVIIVDANTKNPKESATDILTALQTDIVPNILAKYPSVQPLYEGQNREATKMGAAGRVVLPIILFLIYGIISFTFRSYSQPLILLLLVPLSIIGVGWGHYIHDFPINILSLLGIIALIGIMVNDGLVFIEKFNFFLRQDLSFREAMVQAGKSRFRAILLTSITTVAGLAPLIFETSRQAQFLIPMAISIAYGIAIGTFITLLVLPLSLAVVNQFKVYTEWLWEGKKPSRKSVERAVREIKELEHADI